MLRLIFAGTVFLTFSTTASAHHVTGGPLPGAWNLDPWLVAMLGASAILYVVGVTRLWRRAGAGRGIRRAQAVRFGLGWALLCAALISPIDALGDVSFAMHMVQHELLMVAAAPLLVMGRPVEAWAWGLPAAWRPVMARATRVGIVGKIWDAMTEPVGAWAIHAVMLWGWHAPFLFEAALADERIHVAQHACFFASALLFWWSVMGRGRQQPDGASVASLFTTMLHTATLGALLTFAPNVWYPHYAAASLGLLTPLEDQQLGGLVMWVPGGFSYMAAGLAIVASWLARDRPREAL